MEKRSAAFQVAEGSDRLLGIGLISTVAAASFLADLPDASRAAKVRAVEAHAMARCFPWAANSRWFADVFGKPVKAIAAELPEDEVVAAQERGRQRDLWEMVHELRAEFER